MVAAWGSGVDRSDGGCPRVRPLGQQPQLADQIASHRVFPSDDEDEAEFEEAEEASEPDPATLHAEMLHCLEAVERELALWSNTPML